MMNLNGLPDWVIVAGVATFVAIFTSGVISLTALLGGWRQLARRYRAAGPTQGTRWRFQSASMRRYLEANYGGCLTVVANEEGLGLAMTLFWFRFAHPPLFIPWSDVLVNRVRRWLIFERVRITFAPEPAVWLEIDKKLAGKIQAVIHEDWLNSDVETT